MELKYSEFDSVHSMVFFDKNPNIQYGEDSVYTRSHVLKTTFKPLKEGEIFLSGTYAEFGANVNYTSELMIAEKPFRVRIDVNK
ncbi:MAG: hypothetical protein IPM42_21415 [Saprospiraceae bacterium]|nr:hypothetical protein [Saprospiraceae bacterium]